MIEMLTKLFSPKRDWVEFYKPRLNDDYYQHLREYYKPFYQRISSIYHHNGYRRVIDMGCGPAFSARILHKEYNVKSIDLLDSNRAMLGIAGITIRDCYPWVGMPMIKADVTNRPPVPRTPWDIVYSHGLLEHFSDRNIRYIIRYQKTVSRKVIHYVPSHLYQKPSFGDERLMTEKDWNRIAKPDVILPFNNGYDYILEWAGDNR
jgi:SAM-dependent methyltransferase